MLFSCLVDADFLDTEAFMDGEQILSARVFPSLVEFKSRFDNQIKSPPRAGVCGFETHLDTSFSFSSPSPLRAGYIFFCAQVFLVFTVLSIMFFVR